MTDPVTYPCALNLDRATVERVALLLYRHRRALGTRRGRRVLGCFARAVVFSPLDAGPPPHGRPGP